MKPLYLEFCGINSFSEKAQIDFSALLSGGVFGIFGDTGSGKSTILDSIHFALYGEIDRAPKSLNDCINYRLDSAYVVFDFEITTEGVRKTYRVRRERKRKNSVTKAYLYEYTENKDLFALAEGTREVDAAVERIVGLSFADFKTCIALPQGDFASRVKATPSERVKLVARLFNLEKYGERLIKAANEKYYRAEEEVNLVKARMGENEGGRDEIIEQIRQTIAADKQALITAKKTLDKADEALNKALEIEKEKKGYDELCTRLQTLTVQLPRMEEKRKLLENYPRAKAVKEKSEALKTAQEQNQTAQKEATLYGQNYERVCALLKEAQISLQENNYDGEILKISLDLQKVNEAEADAQAESKAKKELDDCVRAYNELKNKCVEEDFEGKYAKLEAELDTLGEDDTLLGYLKKNYKGVLLSDTYGEIRADLRALSEKYPQTQADVETLLQKYTLSGDAKNAVVIDVAAVNLAFKELEKKRKLIKTEMETLEKRKRVFEENEHKKKLLIEQGKILRQNYETAMQKTAAIKHLGTAFDLKTKLDALKNKQNQDKKKVEELQQSASELYAKTQKSEGLCALHEKTLQTAKTALKSALEENGFENETQAFSVLQSIGEETKAKAECEAFFKEYDIKKHEYERADKEKFLCFDETQTPALRENKRLAQSAQDDLHRKIGAEETELSRLLALREKYKEQEKELAAKEKQKNLCDELRLLLRGNRFLEFIACEYLQEICVSASKTLLSLTGGRYFLQYDKDFKVGDNLDGGNLRAVKTLSGGETFLVSLSLALSLSAAICLKSLRPIEFFFLDEGFGTLDEKLVDTVMDVLGKLSKSFTVGLISHVEELKHRIDNKIVVTGANEKHGSLVRVETY